jgi:SAM-dependent methyltransferase
MADALIPSPADALAAWASRVRANREQAEHVREGEPPKDFYAPVASNFKADPHRADEPALDALRALVQPGETWLDIGAGGGRYALPLALLAREVIAVEPSDGMLAVLREGMSKNGIANVRIVQSPWPCADAPVADVALISHIGYDIEQIGPFLDAMETAARRLCVAVLLAKSPPYLAEPFWPPVHGEPRSALPALPEFLALLLARGKLFDVRILHRSPIFYPAADSPMNWLYQQLFISPETEKGRRLAALARESVTEQDGRWALSWEAAPLGIVTWRP